MESKKELKKDQKKEQGEELKKDKVPRKKMSMFFIREDLKQKLKIYSAKKQKSMSAILTELLQVFFKVA